MKNILRTFAAPAFGVLAAAAVAFAPAAGASTVFAASDNAGALVTQHPVTSGEVLHYKGKAYTVVSLKVRTGPKVYYQFHTAPALNLTGIVTFSG
jgi:hypothetical protein